MREFDNAVTPSYIIDEDALRSNGEILKRVQEETGCKILLAQKAFSCYGTYGLLSEYVAGTTASGINEAILGREEMGIPYGKETHVYAPAFSDADMKKLVDIVDHIVFNNLSQWKKHRETVNAARKNGKAIQVGIRVNPEYSEIETDIYNPCFTGSRLGTTLSQFEKALAEDCTLLEGIDGLHFHTMCEQGSETLERTIPVVIEKFGKYLKGMKWLNFGGGHHITKPGYDVDKLIACVKKVMEEQKLCVYLEPGEAVALNAGYLVTEVLDTGSNGMDYAIVDTSAACHMPDVLEMPYRPMIIGSGESGEKAYTYRLGGPTCLAGDIIGEYSFDKPLESGDRLVFTDMAIYSMCKNNTFNGMNLPSIYLYNKKDGLRLYKEFGYEDFKCRI